MDKRYQIFVSSTYDDLIDERKEVTRAILMCDCFPAGMELFPASSRSQWDIIKRVIDDSDYYLLIIAGRYGSIGTDENGQKVSYTEMEFDYAVSINKPIIALLHRHPEELLTFKQESQKRRLEKFRQKAQNGRLVQFWKNKDQLSSAVLHCLPRMIKENPAFGWAKTSAVNSTNNNGEALDVSAKAEYFDLSGLLSAIDKIHSVEAKVKYIRDMEIDRKEIVLNDRSFLDYYVSNFLNTSLYSEEIIAEAISIFCINPVKNDSVEYALNKANIIELFRTICRKVIDNKQGNPLAVRIIQVLRNKRITGDYYLEVLELLKENISDSWLKKTVEEYFEWVGSAFDTPHSKKVADYLISELDNPISFRSKGEICGLLTATLNNDSDLLFWKDFFSKSDIDVKKHIIDGIISNWHSFDPVLYEYDAQEMFLYIFDEVYAWENEYTAMLLVHCLFYRTGYRGIFTDAEVIEKIGEQSPKITNSVFYEMMQDISIKSEEVDFFSLNDTSKELFKEIIKLKKHPRERKLLELFE